MRSFQLGGLNPNQSFTIALEVCTDVGCTLSNTTTATTEPRVPIWTMQPVARALDTTRIELEWPAPSSINQPLLGYDIFRNSSLVVTRLNTTTFVDNGLIPDVVYSYLVRATNEFGSADSLSLTTKTLSAAPSNLTAPTLVPSARYINASWTSPSVAPGLAVQNYTLTMLAPSVQDVCTTSGLSCSIEVGLESHTQFLNSLDACCRHCNPSQSIRSSSRPVQRKLVHSALR